MIRTMQSQTKNDTEISVDTKRKQMNDESTINETEDKIVKMEHSKYHDSSIQTINRAVIR